MKKNANVTQRVQPEVDLPLGGISLWLNKYKRKLKIILPIASSQKSKANGRKLIASSYIALSLIVLAAMMTQGSGCVHEPILVDPIDTTGNPIDTMPIDTTPFIPCEDGVIYFEYDVLPILIANCSVPTCHDDVSHQEGIILTSYDKVMATGKVEPFDLSGSDLFEVITENEEDKRMPRSPQLPLTQQQIEVIATWILQGARNLTCDLDTACSTTNVSFAATVNPIIIKNCRGCHSGPNPAYNISLENYAGIKTVAQSGQLYGAIARLQGYKPMPRNRGPLQNCEIAMIKAWIDAGMPEN